MPDKRRDPNKRSLSQFSKIYCENVADQRSFETFARSFNTLNALLSSLECQVPKNEVPLFLCSLMLYKRSGAYEITDLNTSMRCLVPGEGEEMVIPILLFCTDCGSAKM